MIEIYDLQNCEYSDRHGSYGGLAGDKDGILIDGEYWIVKYPKRTRSLKNVEISYTTAPLSEYIGSHIYEILGYDVHKTILGIRNDRLVVACKEFCENPGDLREIRTLKNTFNPEIERELESTHNTSDIIHGVDLEELLLQLKYNKILLETEGVNERFWECAVIDILINNNDRNNGNWGVLKTNDGYRLAPIFDNGSFFYNKTDTSRMEEIANDDNAMKQKVMSIRTAYNINNKPIYAKKLLSLDYPGLKEAVLKLTPVIRDHFKDFKEMMMSVPENYEKYTVMPTAQKNYYFRQLEATMDNLIVPKYEELVSQSFTYSPLSSSRTADEEMEF